MALDVNNLLGFPSKSQQISEVVLDSPNGQGNINTSVKLFTALRKSVGSALSAIGVFDVDYSTYVLVNEDGIYAYSYGSDYNAAAASSVSITRNSRTLNAAPSLDDVLIATGSPSGVPISVTGISFFRAGDKIRVQTPGGLFSSNTVNQVGGQAQSFRITQVAKI
jgi:hypothetical protein